MDNPTTHPATILLVEDSTLTRKALSHLLTAAGYSVLEASDGEEGVELFTRQPDAIDLVVSDLIMPHLSGLEMLHVLKRLRPQVKLILITGAPIDALAWHEQGVYDWHSKSLAFDQLLSKVTRALATPHSILAVSTPSGTVRFPITILEPTADPGALFVQVDTKALVPEGTYLAVLEGSAKYTPGQYTIVKDGGTAQKMGLQGIFRPA